MTAKNRGPVQARRLGPANRDVRAVQREPLLAQIASFVDLFVWLLVLKSFFLPLFIIPTGSMAETLAGAHATHTCRNCGREYMIGPSRGPDRDSSAPPPVIQCPNCRWQESTDAVSPTGVDLRFKKGDRIVVHGWPFDFGGWLGPRRWDVVVFRNPNNPRENYIKRLIGLPGETIELIDGDVFVQEPDEREMRIARKTQRAQESLWFRYFDLDHLPFEPGADGYYPHWIPVDSGGGWTGLDTRTPRFDAPDGQRQEIVFVTEAGQPDEPGVIEDVYGYNGPLKVRQVVRGGVRTPSGQIVPGPERVVEIEQGKPHTVTDVRLSANVTVGDGDGYVELRINKYLDQFFARWHADGRLVLEHRGTDGEPEVWGEAHIAPGREPRRLALGHADYHLTLEVDGRRVLESTPELYDVTRAEALRRAATRRPTRVRIAAERIVADFAHVQIDRDVYYISGNGGNYVNGVQGNPVTIPSDAYFVLGDNSPASLDSRAWDYRDLGPHLRDDYEAGRYEIGTVPANQMIGRAFLVYWPGFLPLTSYGPNLLPDIGRVRWID